MKVVCNRESLYDNENLKDNKISISLFISETNSAANFENKQRKKVSNLPTILNKNTFETRVQKHIANISNPERETDIEIYDKG